MARLPTPGRDSGIWGSILNDFLSQAHNSDGTLKNNLITAGHIQSGTITETLLAPAVQSKLNATSSNGINVRDYGAVGDGITDDSAAIKAAQAAMTDNKTLFFPSGTYRFARLSPADRGAVVLAGLNYVGIYFEPGAVLLMDNLDSSGTGTSDGILVSGRAKYVSIINPHVRWKTLPSTRGGHANGIHIMGYPSDTTPASGWLGSTGLVQHLTLINALVEQSPEAGILFVGASDVSVVGTKSIDTLADGLHFTGCRRVTVNGHDSLNVGDDGLAFVNYYHPTQKWADPYIGPFWFPDLNEWCSSGTASGVVVSGNRANGFRVQMGQDISINGITVIDKEAVFNLTSAKLDSNNPWQSLASNNVIINGVVGVDCDGGCTIQTYNIDGDDESKWWDFKGCEISNVTMRNIGNWSMSTEQKDTDKSAISGITIKNLKAFAGDNTPGQSYGGHGGIRLAGLVNSVVDGVELFSDHPTAGIFIVGASQMRTEHQWTDPTTHITSTVNAGITVEDLPPSNLIIDNIVAHDVTQILIQDIAGLTIGRIDSYEGSGVGTAIFRVKDAKIQHIGAVNPGRSEAIGRGAQIDQCYNIDIQEIVIDIDSHLSSSIWQALEVGGGNSAYPAGKGIRIEKVIYTSTRNDTVSDIAIQSGTYAPTDYYVQARWLHRGESPPKWRSQLFGETNQAYLSEYNSHPLYINTNQASIGASTGEISPWNTVVGEIDFDTLTTQGLYFVTGPDPGYLYDGTTAKHQPPGAPGDIFLDVVTKHRDDSGETIVQSYVSLGNSQDSGGYRTKNGDAVAWSSWIKYSTLADGSIHRELFNGNVIGTMEGTRTGNITSAAAPTFSTDGWDVLTAVNWAHDVTNLSTNATGTPTSGMRLRFRIQDNGAARAWSWGAKFIPGPAPLLTTTVAGRRHYVVFEYDDAAAAWVCVACDAVGF
ncbi:MAG: hypothetical protein JWO07_548 [Candidatus Saccharibacteria bacterium]|nr:hypothetical protein [Candidatus Saccharibacteria bacterium]